MRIDFHTHAFPDKIAAGALAHLLENTRTYESLYGSAHAHTDATLAGLTASSRAAGLDISLMLPIATSPKPSETLNNFAAFADKPAGSALFWQRASAESAGTGGGAPHPGTRPARDQASS